MRVRVGGVTFALAVLIGWLYLAPVSVGGSTNYVITRGNSMEPRFHSGDLALVRAASDYRVGEIVAYRSSLLHTVVLHRIIARDGSGYVFKGDHNNFIDPTHPGRGELIGALWLHLPRAGVLLAGLHAPLVAAALAGGTALLLLLVAKRRRRRRDRRRRDGTRPFRTTKGKPVTPPRPTALQHLNPRVVFIAAAVAAAAFLILGLVAVTLPATKSVTVKAPYIQRVSFGYHAAAPVGPVYPNGTVTTGQPIFLRLVHRIHITTGYRFAAAAPHQLTGSIDVLGTLTGPTGWSRTIELASPRHFAGDRTGTNATIDLAALRSLTNQVEMLTGVPAGGDYTLTITPRVHIAGKLAGQQLNTGFGPHVNFQLNPLQLQPGGASTPPAGQSSGFTPSQRETLAGPARATNTLSIAGHGLAVNTARWIALVGLLLAAATALLSQLRQRHGLVEPTHRIPARYKHLIIPIASADADAARPAIDVTSIDGLAQLAERSERLILHHQTNGTNTYLVDDEGTLYRYQT